MKMKIYNLYQKLILQINIKNITKFIYYKTFFNKYKFNN